MRLDKFLKVARIIKRRSVANQACSGQRVLVNDRDSKPSKQLKEGDMITVFFGNKSITLRVNKLPSGNVRKEDVDKLYEIVENKNEL